MIICHPLKMIFVKTKKVGGTSFEIILANYCSEDCIITEVSPADERLRKQLGYRTAQNFDYSSPLNKFKFWSRNRGYTGKFWSHIKSEQIKAQIPENVWNDYTKIAIHRNPFDALVSRYFWSQRNVEEEKRQPFDQWFLDSPQKARVNLGIAPLSGEFAMDRVLRYECLEQDINALGIDGFWDLFSSMKAKGNTQQKARPAKDTMYLGQAKVVDVISELCAEEIDYFGYEVPRA